MPLGFIVVIYLIEQMIHCQDIPRTVHATAVHVMNCYLQIKQALAIVLKAYEIFASSCIKNAG